jgi:hypothetical protein
LWHKFPASRTIHRRQSFQLRDPSSRNLACGKIAVVVDLILMRRLFEIIVVAGVFSSAFFFSAATGVARPEYARRTQKECNFCHPPDSWNLTNAGKYYRDHHYSLQGYAPPKADSKQGKG